MEEVYSLLDDPSCVCILNAIDIIEETVLQTTDNFVDSQLTFVIEKLWNLYDVLKNKNKYDALHSIHAQHIKSFIVPNESLIRRELKALRQIIENVMDYSR